MDYGLAHGLSPIILNSGQAFEKVYQTFIIT